METQQVCGGCAFWKKNEGETIRGDCWYFPPTVGHSFPTVSSTTWCGQFKPKEEIHSEEVLPKQTQSEVKGISIPKKGK